MIHVNEKEKALVDGNTGEVIRPTCWDTLVPYVSYLKSRGHQQMAQDVLKQVMDGERVITKMIACAQKHDLIKGT